MRVKQMDELSRTKFTVEKTLKFIMFNKMVEPMQPVGTENPDILSRLTRCSIA
jgi:hypothetical protein